MAGKDALKLTSRTVEALSVEGRDAVFWDRDLPGFGVRVYRTGRKVWCVQTRGPGGPKRATVGLAGEVSAAEARRQAAVLIDRIKRGQDPAPPEPEPELTRGRRRSCCWRAARSISPAALARPSSSTRAGVSPRGSGSGSRPRL